MFRRIHGGHFSIQGHVDLHGLNLIAAKYILMHMGYRCYETCNDDSRFF